MVLQLCCGKTGKWRDGSTDVHVMESTHRRPRFSITEKCRNCEGPVRENTSGPDIQDKASAAFREESRRACVRKYNKVHFLFTVILAA